jgi:hypothetical protein
MSAKRREPASPARMVRDYTTRARRRSPRLVRVCSALRRVAARLERAFSPLMPVSFRPLQASASPVRASSRLWHDRRGTPPITATGEVDMMKLFSMLARVPWGLLIVLAMWLAYTSQTDLSGTLGLVFIGLCVFVVIVEFFKSGDIRLGPFMLDLIFSVTAIVAGTALLTHMIMQPAPAGGMPGFHYILGGIVLLVDAILSPFNSFRTALRNFQVGGDA